MKTPRVSVIMPVFGADRTLETALSAVRASDYPDYEIIAADDGSTDASRRLLEGAGVSIVELSHSGPAAARNVAVRASRGEILFFTDADVEISPDTIGKGVADLVADPDLAAVFGSYTPEPGEGGFFTRYKNYLHHYTHQEADENAFTFWTGCGFVRRSVFDRLGGFDEEQRFLSDVEFGYRMHLAGERVRIDKSIQVVHHKQYDLRGLLRSDFYGRAVPWTRLIMRHRTVRGDLNLKAHNVLSVPLSFIIVLALLGIPFGGAQAVVLALAGFAALAWLNRDFLGFVQRREGRGFAARTLVIQWVIYLLSGLGVVAATLGFRSGGR